MARLLVTAASLLAFAASAGAGPVPVLFLDRTSAQANERVTVRIRAYHPGPASTLSDAKPYGPSAHAPTVA